MVKVAYLGMRKQIVERSRGKIDMCGAIALDIPQDFERVEFWHNDVSRTLRTQCEGQHTGSMRQRGGVQADWILAISAPIVRSHLGHRAPSQIGDANTFGGPGRAAGGN